MPDDRMRPTVVRRAASVVLLGLVFAGGAATTAAVQRAQARSRPSDVLAAHGPRLGLSPVLARLNLTPAQRARIDALVVARRRRTEDIMRTPLAQLRANFDSLRAEMAAELEPAQRATLDSLFPALDGEGGGSAGLRVRMNHETEPGPVQGHGLRRERP